METLIVHSEGESFYDPDYVEMIKQGDEDLKAGKGVAVDIDNLW
jgi:hypothetical protein